MIATPSNRESGRPSPRVKSIDDQRHLASELAVEDEELGVAAKGFDDDDDLDD